jgi:endonuclease YncB( thermonuclease family)
MTKINSFVLFLVLFLLPALAFAWQGKAVHIADGDTITVLRDGREQVRIRVYGVDTPERSQAFGKRAKQFTASMVGNKLVEIEPVDQDRYGRTVARVFVGGRELSEELVRAGMAWVYVKYCRIDACSQWAQAEAEARAAGVGLWADPSAAPPWEYRHGGPSKSQTRESQRVASGGAYHGNANSHKFHHSGCRHFNCKNCDVIFGSRDEAIQAGYSPCGMCRP